MTGNDAVGRARTATAPAAIVIGLDTVLGLHTCRILARRGVRVVGIAADRRHPACLTNTASRLVIAATSGERLVSTLEQMAGQEAGAVLFPCTDASVRTLAEASQRLHALRPLVPTVDAIDALCDEPRFGRLARLHGLPVPAARVVVDTETARTAARELRFPCQVKLPGDARHPCTGRIVRSVDDAPTWLATAEQLLARHPELVIKERPASHPAVQRYTCRCYVSPRGLPILTFVTRSVRHWPPGSGPPCLEEAVEDATVRSLAMAVVSCVPFVGMATVESERDPTTGDDWITAVTVGRPTDRFPIVEAGGVELLYTMYRDAIAAPLPVDRHQYSRPVKWIHLGNDLRAAAHAIRAGELTPSGWLRSLSGQRVYARFDIRDLAPSAAQIAGRVRDLLPTPHGRPWRQRRRPGDGLETPAGRFPQAPP